MENSELREENTCPICGGYKESYSKVCWLNACAGEYYDFDMEELHGPAFYSEREEEW